MRILVIGAGGHGQVVADILLSRARQGDDLIIEGYLDDDPALYGQRLLGLSVLGPIAALDSIPHDATIVAIGANRTRQHLVARLLAAGERLCTAIHPAPTVACGVHVGAGSVLCAGAVVNPGTTVGVGAILNTCCSVDHHNIVADFVHVAPGVHTGGCVSLQEGAFVALGASVIPGCTVGAWATVGAGAVVIRDVPPGATVVGAPARALHPGL